MPRLTCPACSEEFRVPADSPSPSARCPACKHRFAIEKDAKPADRPRKKKKRPASGFPVATWMLVGGGGGASLLLVGLIVGLWLLLRGGGGQGNPTPVAGDDPAVTREFVAVTSSTAPLADKVPFTRPSPLEPAAPDDAPLPPLPALVAFPPAAAAVGGTVRLDPDPAKEKPRDWAPNLTVPLNSPHISPLPLLSSLGSRFAVFANHVDDSYRIVEIDDPKVPGRKYLTPNNVPKTPPPLDLTDLSTGEKAGTYTWNVPLARECRLAPDGEHLVAAANRDLLPPGVCLMDVWKKGSSAPLGQFKVAGKIRWFDFCSASRVVFYTVGDEPAVQIWDIVERKLLHSLPAKAPIAGMLRPAAHAWFAQQERFGTVLLPTLGRVSDGGRYLALGTGTDVLLYDLPAAKEVGRLPVAAQPEVFNYDALGFLPEKNQLVAILQREKDHLLCAWDLATGRELHRNAPRRLPGATNGLSGTLYPGPLPDTVLVEGYSPQWIGGTSSVIDVRSGNVLHALDSSLLVPPVNGRALARAPMADARKVAPERLKAFTNPSDHRTVVFTVPYDPKASVAAVTTLSRVTEPRPAVRGGDRAGLAVSEPTPPAKWAQPPTGAWAKSTAEPFWLPEMPTAFADGVGVGVRYVIHKQPLPRVEVVCDRFDLGTGKRVGEPVTLWPWTVNPLDYALTHRATTSGLDPQIPPAALTADGDRLAFADPAERHRVDVWDARGERQTGFYAAPPGQAIDWLGWTADGALLTVANGLLTAWDAKAGKALYAVHGGYGAKCELAQGRKWGVFTGSGRIDLLDVTNGKCLGRCRAKGVPAAVDVVRLSPDGGKLLVVTKGGPASPKKVHTGWVWDLATGKADQFDWLRTEQDFFKDLHWAGWISPDQFVLCNDVPAVFDLRAKCQVTGLESFARAGLCDKAPWFTTMPDGRLWVHWRVKTPTPELAGPWGWQQLALPDAAAMLTDDKRQFVDFSKDPLAIEIDLGDKARSLATAQKVADTLAARGYKIGGGWRLQLVYGQAQGAQTLSGGMSGEVRIHSVEFTWRLVSPDGTKAWSTSFTRGLLGNGSRYFKGSKSDGPAMPGQQVRIDSYDFGMANPQKASNEEILEWQSKHLEVPGVPTWGGSVPGSATQLPLPGKWVPR